MKLVSAAKYAALRQRYEQTVEARDKAEKLAAERLSTITRLSRQVTDLREEKPTTPLPEPEPAQGDAELRRRLALAERTIRELSAQLDGLQASHVADTRELHDLRQGVAS